VLPLIRNNSFTILAAALAFSTFATVTAQAETVDHAQCPDANGTYKQNGKAPFQIAQGTVQGGAMAYQIDKELYIVDLKAHTMKNGDRYVATCSEGVLGIQSYNPSSPSKKKSMKLQNMFGFGNLNLETDEDQSIADQALINVGGIAKLPPHSQSQCPSDFSGKVFSNHPDYLSEDDQPRSVSIERISDGIEFQLGSKSWKVDGGAHNGSEGLYQASCINNAIYINTMSNGKFVDSKVFSAAGKFRTNFLHYNYKAEGKFTAGAFFPPM
jgi:hypothetical protein